MSKNVEYGKLPDIPEDWEASGFKRRLMSVVGKMKQGAKYHPDHEAHLGFVYNGLLLGLIVEQGKTPVVALALTDERLRKAVVENGRLSEEKHQDLLGQAVQFLRDQFAKGHEVIATSKYFLAVCAERAAVI